MQFQDRRDAGRQLARLLRDEPLRDPVVLALPRGGVPVAFEIADALGAPLDVFVARKIGAPGRQEVGIGAVAEGCDAVVTTDAVRHLGLTPDELEYLAQRERVELQRRVERYRRGAPLPPLSDRDVVVVDDGLATGVTAEAALQALRPKTSGRLLMAVPVCAADAQRRLARYADRVVCVLCPQDMLAVGLWYHDFRQTPDDEVLALLDRARSRPASPDRA